MRRLLLFVFVLHVSVIILLFQDKVIFDGPFFLDRIEEHGVVDFVHAQIIQQIQIRFAIVASKVQANHRVFFFLHCACWDHESKRFCGQALELQWRWRQKLDFLEERGGYGLSLGSFFEASEFQNRFALSAGRKRNLCETLQHPLRDFVAQALHQLLHHHVASVVYVHRGDIVQRCVLQIDDDQFSSLGRFFGHVARRRDCQRAPQDQMHVRFFRVLFGTPERFDRQGLSEVDRGIHQSASTGLAILQRCDAVTARVVIATFLESVTVTVAKVLESASLTEFNVPISVKFGDLVRMNATPSVKSIAILADQIFTNAKLLELEDAHVCGGGHRTQRVGGSFGTLFSLCFEGPDTCEIV